LSVKQHCRDELDGSDFLDCELGSFEAWTAFGAPDRPSYVIRADVWKGSIIPFSRNDTSFQRPFSTEFAMSSLDMTPAISLNSLDARGAIVPRQRWSRGQIGGRLANIPP